MGREEGRRGRERRREGGLVGEGGQREARKVDDGVALAWEDGRSEAEIKEKKGQR